MNNISTSKIKIRWNGYELELEGTEQFVTSESERLLGKLIAPSRSNSPTEKPSPTTDDSKLPIHDLFDVWRKIAQPHVRLRGLWGLRYAVKNANNGGPWEAALLVLAIHHQLEKRTTLTALELMRALKASGYNPSRLDIHLKLPVAKGWMIPSGSRRARRYEITNPGINEAMRLAYELYPQLVKY